MDKMFCFQCEQTARGSGCTVGGVCGKSAETAELLDQLTGCLIALGKEGFRHEEKISRKTMDMIQEGLFTGVTNVNFHSLRIAELLSEAQTELLRLKGKSADYPLKAKYVYHMEELWSADKDIRSLKSLILFGLRGMAAYAVHARALGYAREDIDSFFLEALNAIAVMQDPKELLSMVLQVGQMNLKTMALLDQAHTSTYGIPTPGEVSMTIEPGPFIVVTGHDLKDLEMLLQQTEGKGISIYTHGEMLPAHGYPKLRQYKHLKGNFGTAWQNQRMEFSDLPAPILFTTNCLMPPQKSYSDRVFTTGMVSFPGAVHIEEKVTMKPRTLCDYCHYAPRDEHCTYLGSEERTKDFTPVIEKALELKGYPQEQYRTGINGRSKVTTGYSYHTLRSYKERIIQSIQSGHITHFFLVGGCDGAKPGRNYYTEFVKQCPETSIILTLACGKYRFNDLDLGEIDGIPRILDLGQCNDAYGAIMLAESLAEAFSCSINELPLSLVLSWYEQKAVAVLLTLLHLGFKHILLGPTLPAFLSPHVLSKLQRLYKIDLITTPEKDLRKLLKR